MSAKVSSFLLLKIWQPQSIAMHPSALRQRLCPYSICFLDVYPVCHGGGLATKCRKPLWTSVQISESMHLQTHFYQTFFPCSGEYYHLLKYFALFFNTLHLFNKSQKWSLQVCHILRLFQIRGHTLTLIVPSANSVSPLKIAVANQLIHAIYKNCIVYLFL